MVVKYEGSLVMLKFDEATKNEGESKLEIRIRGKQTNKTIQLIMDSIESLLSFHFPNKIKTEEIVFACQLCGNEMSFSSVHLEDFLLSGGSPLIRLACLKGSAVLVTPQSSLSFDSNFVYSYNFDHLTPDLSISSFGVLKIPNRRLTILNLLGEGFQFFF